MTSEKPDITAGITDLQSAFSAADALLSDMPGHDREDSSYWKAIATIPLAGLLYAVSPQGAGGGIAEARRIARDPDDTAGWLAVADTCDQPVLADALRKLLEYSPQQRASVQLIIHSALQ
ncbi:Uncharacterised protein [Mycobacteroides abscessus subsp. abscessus]|uniref:hypothetical protein n=1 Tax=Mycobacteroides abscessus TaxID=36809 RepID=UPI0009A6B8F8|nr:hypothetical protein [Mycobacteroides abscessus]SLI00757.1 Uncharacterised protein [Mycobacteroides abscessus subsp. abscessus]